MRRTFAAAAVCLSLGLALLSTGTSAADPDRRIVLDPPAERTSAPEAEGATPREALTHAAEVLAGSPASPEAGPGAATDATAALRDLFVALPRLTGEARERAEGLLARPTDGANDEYGDGYTTRSRRTCSTKLCVHWVPTTIDAPPSRRWVDTTMRVMKAVWRTELGALGYRRPLRDGNRGGNDKFDVYLKELGSQGLYGYCAPEREHEDYPRLASGYCVLDDDFARAQFGREPIKTLRVTAAHEFFHAVQFAYDYREDRWLMEASATWIEERYADGVNDNRQYLPAGQLGTPDVPLDIFDRNGLQQYGNWVFFEYLSGRFGTGIVKRIWQQAGQHTTDGKTYSTKAVKRVLPDGLAFSSLFTQYAMANTTPAESYPEGDAWGAPGVISRTTLDRDSVVDGTRRIDHLAIKPYRFRPADGLTDRSWGLEVVVDGPARTTRPVAAVVRVTPAGTVKRKTLALDADGRGTATVPFNTQQTARLFVVLGNASTRFECRQYTELANPQYSCLGESLDDGRVYGLALDVKRRS